MPARSARSTPTPVTTLLGWDTDQFPTNIYLTTQCMLCILRMGGFTTGGVNFDAKVRRESFEPIDLFHAHIGGMDAFARGFKIARAIIDRRPARRVRQGTLPKLGLRARPPRRSRQGELRRPRSLYPPQGRRRQEFQRPPGDARESDQRVHLSRQGMQFGAFTGTALLRLVPRARRRSPA